MSIQKKIEEAEQNYEQQKQSFDEILRLMNYNLDTITKELEGFNKDVEGVINSEIEFIDNLNAIKLSQMILLNQLKYQKSAVISQPE